MQFAEGKVSLLFSFAHFALPYPFSRERKERKPKYLGSGVLMERRRTCPFAPNDAVICIFLLKKRHQGMEKKVGCIKNADYRKRIGTG